VKTSAGIIVIDALYDYSVEDEIAGGLTKLGLNPADIKYVIVSHAHGDHVGGAKFLQDRYKARVMLSAADWDLLDQTKLTPRPARDLVATDGQKVTLGDTTITLHLTPGHTPGTMSFLIPVTDGGRRHMVAEWGGTRFSFPPTPENFRTYAASAERFRTGDSGKHQVSLDGGIGPVWAPNGREIFFRNGNAVLSADISLTPQFRVGRSRVLFTGNYAAANIFRPGYDMTPDGNAFIMVQPYDENVVSRMIVAVNWFEELKRLVPAP
jgi:hypothetical protein